MFIYLYLYGDPNFLNHMSALGKQYSMLKIILIILLIQSSPSFSQCLQISATT